MYRRLGRGINRRGNKRHISKTGSDIDETRGGLSFQQRQEGISGVDDAFQIDIDFASQRFGLERIATREIEQRLDAGIADDCRQVRPPLLDTFGQGCDLRRVRNIQDFRLHARMPRGHRFQPIARATGNDDRRTTRVEGPGNTSPDAGASAGDENRIMI